MSKQSNRRNGTGYGSGYELIWSKEPDQGDAVKKQLEQAVIDAAVRLANYEGAAGFELPIPGQGKRLIVSLESVAHERRRFMDTGE